MARSDLLLNIVKAASRGDQALFRRAVEAIIAEERAKQHHVLADRLAEFLNGSTATRQPAPGDERVLQLLHEAMPRRTLDDLILPDVVRQACKEVVEENQRRDLLRSYGLEPRHRLLLIGPPGNGKTSLAEALAEALLVPLLIVRYEGVIGSYLGETASRVARLFDHVRTRQCVLFLDEFDTLGKERGDLHDTGEIKRVVSSLLLQLDGLPSYVLVVTATNHPELLDRAVWRRFQLRLELPAPSRSAREAWFTRFAERIQKPLGYSARTLADRMAGMSFSELEDFGADVLRRHVLSLPNEDLKGIIAERLQQWKARARPSDPAEE